MARIIGDRRENTLDEMEEVARARNKDVAEEERMEALMKAEKAKAPTKPVIIEPSMEDIIDFHGTELFRGDAEALKEIYKAIRKEYTTGRVGINEKRISYLGLGVYNLTEIPDIIGELSRLLRLDLEHNHLAQLPDTLENLPTLKALYAGSNPLDGKAKEMLERMKARGVNVVY